MEQTIRNFTGELKVLSSDSRFIMPVEIKALNSLVNRNNWQYVNLASHLGSFSNIPILTAYLMNGSVIGDGHNYKEKRDRQTGEEYVSFTDADAERIVGWVGDNAARLEVIDGVEWVVLTANLWEWYSRELCEKIARQGSMEVSIETLVTKEHMEGDVAVEEEYIVLGVTVLGDAVSPAVAGAEISVRNTRHLSEIRDAMKDEILKAASYIEDESKEKVQENKFNERMRVSMTYFSRKQCAELSKRFDGYTVLAAAQDNNGIHVALLSDNGDTARYDMNSVDETIAVERIKACEGTVAFDCDNAECCDNADGECCDNTLNCDLSETLAVMNEVVSKANEAREKAEADLQKANEALATAMATIADMRNAENARRVQSAKDIAKRTLSDFNTNSAFEIPESALEAVNKDIDGGMYTEKVNAEGAWIGEAEVALRVKAICADEQQKHNKANAEKNKTTFIWDKLAANEEDDGSVAALLKRTGVRE